MNRLSPVRESDLDDAQRAILHAIQSGPRGNVGLTGPFGVYVRAPSVGDAAEKLGAAVRFSTQLADNVKEVAICTVGAHYRSKFEFATHASLAVKAGVDPSVVDAIHTGVEPVFTNKREQLAHAITVMLLRNHRLDDATYRRAHAEFGESQLVELVVTIGYYILVSLTLNMFMVPLGDGMTDPFPDSQ